MNNAVLIVDDEVSFRELYMRTLADAGMEARAAGSAGEALAAIEQAVPALVVSDVRMPGGDGIGLLREARAKHPDLPFLLVTAYADVRDAVQALKIGAVDYLEKPIDLDELVAVAQDVLGVRGAMAAAEIPPAALEGIVAESHAMMEVLRNAYRVANSDANVLVTGESGTGKEVLAGFIHENSPRRARSLVPVNCAAIPGTLLESELFGYEKGAFTGATGRRKGRFREADNGTLFLDEIGDMPLDLQPSLLRAIETGLISPLGGEGQVEVDIRLVAATNRDLTEEVSAGRFREDLYYRLNVIALELPPLRERPEDLAALAKLFLSRDKRGRKRLSRGATKLLEAHSWPGNVRELANAMEHAALLSRTEIVLPEHLPPALRATAPAESREAAATVEKADHGRSPVKSLKETEIETIKQALDETGGNRTHAAELLGITRRGLLFKIKRYGL